MTKDKLRNLGAEVDRWLLEMPSRALAFHQRGRILKRDIEETLGLWFPGRRIEDIHDQFNEIQTVFEELKKTMIEAADIESRFSRFPELASGLPDPVLQDQIKTRCERWRDRLSPLSRAVNLLSLNEVLREEPTDLESRLSKVRIEVAPYEEALGRLIDLLKRAQKLTAARNPEADVMNSEVKRLMDALRIGDLSPDLLHEINVCVERMESAEKLSPLPPPPPPPSFHNVRTQLGQALNWADTLKVPADTIGLLTDRVRQAEQSRGSHTPDLVSGIQQDVTKELDRLRQLARDRYAMQLADLNEKARYYNHIVPDAPFRLTNLPSPDELEEPEEYEKSQASLGDLRRDFGNLANTKIELLRGHLLDRVTRMKSELDQISFPSSLRGEAQVLADSLDKKRLAQDRDQTLNALRDSSADESKLESLKQRAEQSRLLLKGALEERRVLEEISGQLQIHVVLPSAAEMVEQGLEWSQAGIAWAKLEFLELAREPREAVLRRCLALAEALHKAEGRSIPEAIAAPPEVATVENAASAWRELNILLETLEAEARTWLSEAGKALIESTLPSIEHNLNRLPEDESLEAKGIIDSIRFKDWEWDQEVEGQIVRICEIRSQCFSFFQRLEGEQRRFTGRLDSMKSLYRKIRDEDLRRYFGLHAARAGHLLRGVPANPEYWALATPQLDEAKRLLDLMLWHGRRLAARELEQDCRELRATIEKMNASPSRDDMVRQLAIIEEYDGRSELAPASTRDAIRRLAAKRAHA